MLEEYYTLAAVAEAGIGTAHVDGNTRLCTATAAISLIESFGTDGAPGSYADFDVTEAIFLVGHNMAATQTVLWAACWTAWPGRVRPASLSSTRVARRRPGRPMSTWRPAPARTSPLLNGILKIILDRGWIDSDFVRDHTGRSRRSSARRRRGPRSASRRSPGPVRLARGGGRDPGDLRQPRLHLPAGRVPVAPGHRRAVQVNNLHLIRGLIGSRARPSSR